MTENNAAQPGLTDATLMDLEKQVQRDIPRFGQNVHIGVRAGVLRAMLSKLRAEDAQASDERAAFEAYVQKRFGGLAEPWDANAARYPYGPDQARWEAWRAALAWYAEQVAGCRKIGADGDAARQALDKDGGRRARAALASAPVADESPMAKMADALREKARQERQAYQDSRVQTTEWGPMPHGTEADLPASAPVAGQARQLPTINVGGKDRPQQWFTAKEVRQLLDAAPQASECECARKSKAIADSEAKL